MPSVPQKAYRLKYLATFNDDVFPEDTPPDYAIRYVEISDVTHNQGIVKKSEYTFETAPSRARRKVRDGDVIVSTVRTYLKAVAPIVRPEENLVVSTGFTVVRPKQALLIPRFAGYLFQSEGVLDEIVSRSVGVSYPAVRPEEISDIRVPVPTPDMQKRIGVFLDRETSRVDFLIAKKEHQIELLQEKRQAIVTRAVTKGLEPNAKMKESGVNWIREIPLDWRITSIKRTLEIPMTDGPHDTPQFLDEGVPFVSAEAIWDGRVHFERKRGNISRDQYLEYSRKSKPRRNDVFIVKAGSTTGKIAIVDLDDEFAIWSPLALLRFGKLADPKFAYYYFTSSLFQGLVSTSWSFGTQPNIGMDVLENLPIVVPPVNQQIEISAFLDRALGSDDQLIEKIRESLTLLQEYRTSLITAAVSGQIDVSNMMEKAFE